MAKSIIETLQLVDVCGRYSNLLLSQVDFTNITSWLEDNRLVINLKKGKTETMLFGTEKWLSNLNNQQINLEYNGSKVYFTSCYKYLGIHLRPSLNMNDHVNNSRRTEKLLDILNCWRKLDLSFL